LDTSVIGFGAESSVQSTHDHVSPGMADEFLLFLARVEECSCLAWELRCWRGQAVKRCFLAPWDLKRSQDFLGNPSHRLLGWCDLPQLLCQETWLVLNSAVWGVWDMMPTWFTRFGATRMQTPC